MKKTPLILAATAFVFTGTSGLLHAEPTGQTKGTEATAPEEKNIVEVASENEEFSTLVAAVKAAGLAETLSGEGPFTVFAPTNAAFAALPDGKVEELMKPENKAMLASVLSYHVVPGKVMAADVKPMEATTVNGTAATITMDGDTVMIDDAKVIKTDIPASNGVIHVIDKVILPK